MTLPGFGSTNKEEEPGLKGSLYLTETLGINLESYLPKTLEVGQLFKKGIGRKTPKYQMAQKI